MKRNLRECDVSSRWRRRGHPLRWKKEHNHKWGQVQIYLRWRPCLRKHEDQILGKMKTVAEDRWRPCLRNDEDHFWGTRILHLREEDHLWGKTAHVWGERKTNFCKMKTIPEEIWKTHEQKFDEPIKRNYDHLVITMKGNISLYVANAEFHELKYLRSYCHRFCNVQGQVTPGCVTCAGSCALWEVGDGAHVNLEMDPCMTWSLICCPRSYTQESWWSQSSAALMHWDR
jgi:hypothetical protein